MDSSIILSVTLPFLLLGVAASIAGVLILPFYFHHRTKDRTRLYEMLKQAQESDHPFSPDLIRQIVGSPPPTRDRDIRRGAILLAIAAGITIPTIIVFMLLGTLHPPALDEVFPYPDSFLPLLGVFAVIGSVISILTCVGGTLLVLGLTRRPDKNLPDKNLPDRDLPAKG